MGEVGAAYGGCRTRIGELVRALDDGRAATIVPTCPQWSVHDVVAHVTGVVDDALAGRLDGVASDPWTAAQVEARRDTAIVDEWNAKAPGFEGILDAIGDPGRQAVFDVVSHEHDIRCALGQPGERDSDAVLVGLSFIGPAMVNVVSDRGVSARVVSTTGLSFGDDGAAVTLTGTPFELVRSMSGRRNLDQLRELRWDGSPSDVDVVIGAFTFGPFAPAEKRIDE
jgi:uncharacterized protein (TIGR03083 family)